VKALYHIGGKAHPDLVDGYIDVPPYFDDTPEQHATQCVSIMRGMVGFDPLIFNLVVMYDHSRGVHSTAIEAALQAVIVHADANGYVPIINISIAPYHRESDLGASLIDAVVARGGVLVNGTGNDGRMVRTVAGDGWPVRDKRVVAVGDALWSGSNSMPLTHRMFQAHAEGVPCRWLTQGGDLTDYMPHTGTSFACPQVAAWIALQDQAPAVAVEMLWQRGGDIRVNPEWLLERRPDIVAAFRENRNFPFHQGYREFWQSEMADEIRNIPHWNGENP
jgi:subtilisin family serine protease